MKRRIGRSAAGKGRARLGTRIAWASAGQRPPVGFTAGAIDQPAKDSEPILLPSEAHVMTIAPTGAGKTVNCTVPVLLQYPGPMIVLDPKGENAAITARRRREMGQETFVIDPFGVSGLRAASFNPVDLVEAETAEAADDARALAAMVMPSEFDNRDVFWRNRAMHFLTAAILNAATDFLPDARNLVTVRDIVHKMTRGALRVPSDRPYITQADHVLKSKHPDVARINELFDFGSAETLGGMLHTALEGVGFVRGPLVERSLAHSDFKLDDVTEGAPMTIYLVIPPHLIHSHGILLRVWLGTLFAALMRRRARPDQATLLLLDETAQLGLFPPLRTAITLLRGYGVQTWSFWQDPSQLAQIYPTDWRAMVNNCRIVQCFGAHTEAAWSELGRMLGADLHGFGPLDRSAMLIQQDGDVRLAERIDYRSDRAMRGQFDANPIHERRAGPLRRPHAPVGAPPAVPMPAADGETTGFQGIAAAIHALW